MELPDTAKHYIGLKLMRHLLEHAEGKELKVDTLRDQLRTWQNDGISVIPGQRLHDTALHLFATEMIQVFTGLKNEPDDRDQFAAFCYQFVLWREYSKGFVLGKQAMRRYYDVGKQINLSKDQTYDFVLHIIDVLTKAIAPKQK